MAALKLRYGDVFKLPVVRDYQPRATQDHLWLASDKCIEQVRGATFIDNAHYLSPRQLRKDAQDRQVDRRGLAYVVLHDAAVLDRWAIVDRSGLCYPQMAPPQIASETDLSINAQTPTATVEYEGEEYHKGATVFLPALRPNVSHFLNEGVPHMSLFAPAAHNLLLRLPRRDFLEELCALAGFARDRLIFAPGSAEGDHTLHRFERLIVPFYNDNVDPRLRAAFHRVGRNACAGRALPTRRIYVSRGDTRGFRTCLNEPEVEAVMRRKGVEIFTAGGVSEAEKIALFTSSELVVGCVGAGLYNVAFSNRPSFVLGLRGTTYRSDLLRRMCAVGDHAHGLILGADILSWEPVQRGTHNDFIMHLPSLERRLDMVLQSLDRKAA